MQTQQILRDTGKLLDDRGNLTTSGWATKPILDCNLENCRFYSLRFLQWARIKSWDYYAVTTPTHFFSFTISNIGYLGMVFAYVIEYGTGKFTEETLAVPFASGIQLPRSSIEGVSKYEKGAKHLSFTTAERLRHLSVRWPGFGGNTLNVEIDLTEPEDHESMNIVIPIHGKRFYYNRKINCMPASGWVEFEDRHIVVEPGKALANLDWGRGVWEYRSFWVWASASGFLSNGQTIGLNLGYGFGDTSAATENCFILDDKVHKLGQVEFTYDDRNFKEPWRMVSPDGRLDLTFRPFFERVAKTNALVLKSEVHQMFGRYQGWVVTDAGERIEISNLTGWAEEHHAKW